MNSKSKVQEVFESILEDPLDLFNQSVLALEKMHQVLDTFCEEGLKYLAQDSFFKK